MLNKVFNNKRNYGPARDEIVRILIYVDCVVLRDPPVGLLLRSHFVAIQGCGPYRQECEGRSHEYM
jgi:hypothetical protein